TPPRSVLGEIQARRVTPLVVPSDVYTTLTQKTENTRDVAKEIDIQGLVAKPQPKAAPAQAAVSPQPKAGVPTPSLPDAPQIASSRSWPPCAATGSPSFRKAPAWAAAVR